MDCNRHIPPYTRPQLVALVSLRTLLGWYFLYEGLIKLLNPNWTSLAYLKDSKGWFAPMFDALTSPPWLLRAVDFMNIYGLVVVGLFLILGFFARYATVGAIAFISLYYLSHPPLLAVTYMLPPEGSYLWVDKNLVMLASLVLLLLFPTSKHIGLDRWVYKHKTTSM